MSTTLKEINTRIKLKRDTESNWDTKNPVILNGEVALVDGDDGRLRAKIGNGQSQYSGLEFLDNIYIMTAENKTDPIPTNAVIVIDTTENAGDIGSGGNTVVDGSAYMPKFAVTTEDNGKVLGVVNGQWAVMTIQASGSGSEGTGGTGQDGFSPIVTVESIEGGHRVTITDANDPPKQFDVMDGQDGQDGTPGASITVASVKESEADGGDNVITFSDGTSITIKNGSAGSGQLTEEMKAEIKTYIDQTVAGSGAGNGFSPTINVTDIEGGYEIIITDIDGEKEPIRVMDGVDGKDYILTEDDKTEITNEIKAYIDEKILGGEW